MAISKQNQHILIAALTSTFLYMVMLIPGLFFLNFLTPFPLFVIGLGYSAQAALYSGGLAAFILGFVFKGSAALVYGLTTVIPVVFLSYQALRKPASEDSYKLLRDLTLLMFFVLALAATYFEVKGGFLKTVNTYIDTFITQIEALQLPFEQQALIKKIGVYMPALTLLSTSFLLIVNAVFAVFFLKKRGMRQDLSFDIKDMKVDVLSFYMFLIIMIGLVIGTDSSKFLMKNAAIVACLPFLFGGLAVVHLAASKWPLKQAILMFFYVFMIILGWPLIAVTLLGLLDYLTGVRRRFQM
jgi:hypothetical protein